MPPFRVACGTGQYRLSACRSGEQMGYPSYTTWGASGFILFHKRELFVKLCADVDGFRTKRYTDAMNFERPPQEENQEPQKRFRGSLSEQEGRPQEIAESRELRHNDLITSDGYSDLTTTKETLEKNNIIYKLTRRTYEQRVNKNTLVPGEFIITIFDPENGSKAAPFAYVEKVFALLKKNGVVVRYGRRPNAEEETDALDRKIAS